MMSYKMFLILVMLFLPGISEATLSSSMDVGARIAECSSVEEVYDLGINFRNSGDKVQGQACFNHVIQKLKFDTKEDVLSDDQKKNTRQSFS